MRTFRSFGLAVILACTAFGALAQAPTPTDLGTFGGDYSYPNAVSDRGDVVGNASLPGNSYYHAFHWSAATGMTDLGTLGGRGSQAADVNERGEVVGESDRGDNTKGAFYWSAATGMVDMGSLGGSYSYARDINDSGEAVGYSYLPGNSSYHAFKWSLATGMVDLGTLGPAWSYALEINNAGQVSGYSPVTSGGTHGFLWSQSTGMLDIGDLGGTGGYDTSYPRDLNESGELTGFSYDSSGRQHAFYWSQATGMLDLGTLTHGFSYGFDINNSGQIAGYFYDYIGNNYIYRGFVWSLADGLTEIATPGGYDSSFLYGINNAGQAIGYARNNSRLVPLFWSVATGAIIIPSFGGQNAFPDAINESGQVVGGGQTATGDYHALAWSLDSGTTDLGTLNGSLESYAWLINSSGLAAGSSYRQPDGYGTEHAVVWSLTTPDTTPPVITLNGGDMEVEACTGFTDPGATALDDRDGDISSGIVVTGSVDDDTPGVYVLRYNVSDAAGNPAEEMTRTVTVSDTTPPSLSAVTTDPSVLSTPNHKLVDVTASYTAQDSCSATVICSLAVSSNEPVSGPGDTGPDWVIVSDRYLQLRAERAGNGSGSGRVYTVGVTCSDASGNPASGSAQVLVPKSQKK